METLSEEAPRRGRHVAVVGGGVAGLAASHDLVRAGFRVTLLEAEPVFGGLASSNPMGGREVERFYHFICRADRDLIGLVRELGLQDKLHWRQTLTAFYHQGRYYPFGTPFDLIRFFPIPWLQRLRFGFHIVQSRYRLHWERLDKIPAKTWLIDHIGEQAYRVIWHPLLKVKFGDYHEDISAAWVWHRIWRVASSRQRVWDRECLGYLENGSGDLVHALVDRLRRSGAADLRNGVRLGEIRLEKQRVTGVRIGDQWISCDAVVSTVPLPILLDLLPRAEGAYFDGMRQIRYIGVVCMVLNLEHSLSPAFWLNIHDERISVNGVIEQTNLNQNLEQGALNLLYIPYYTPVEAERFQMSDEALFHEYMGTLRILNDRFTETWVREWAVYRARHAQAICTTGFAELVPQIRSPIQGLFITDSTQFYPEDRTISAAIRQGRRAARQILESVQWP